MDSFLIQIIIASAIVYIILKILQKLGIIKGIQRETLYIKASVYAGGIIILLFNIIMILVKG